jgi:hypothetical protein
MKVFRSRGLFFWVFLALYFCVAECVSAQAYKAEALSEAPPTELSGSVREALSPTVIRVSGSGGVLCDIWLRKAVPGKANALQSLGAVYPQLAQGTLLAAIRFPKAVKDYRKQTIKAGVYTLRYLLLPEDGNHMGVAAQRDFVLASPAEPDGDSATTSIEQTIALSRKATGSKHPSVWSLGPPEDHPQSLPSVFHLQDGDLWLVEFDLPLQTGTGDVSVVSMALVVAGSAPQA